ncbi:TPA: UbiA family prenyltransferase [archaeon]|uniref:UbiA family prenyltransferase n=1 Tax=Candidatus Naiadarchaeum limnaeum TaxID=2756139 RepID=A0A832V2R5_9ARCH|nr:UbiA family prenyltransferase [Candidatus Naiadarchaeales archaeon SRR2090153.bin1042]HIJ99936.1 UbiA family prenyltransferase [Candidatus Naiadarchaeum limnaeum]
MQIQEVNLFVLNSVKNLSQFAVGFGLGVATFGYTYNVVNVILAVLSLLLTYTASYFYNDIVDLSEDKKDPFKLRFKPIARGDLKVETAKILMIIFSITGIALSLIISFEFFAVIIILTTLNFVYSSPYTRFKKSVPTFAFTIFLLEFFKFTTGWLSVVSSFAAFPLIFLSTMSMLYVFFVYVYKKKLSPEQLLRDYIVFLVVGTGIILYAISVLIYPYKFQLIISPSLFLLILVPWFIYGRRNFFFEQTVYSMLIGVLILFIVSAMLFVTPTGVFDPINAKISTLLSNAFS